MIIITNYVEMAEYFLAEYPKESCGVIKDGIFYQMQNVAEVPEDSFKMDSVELIKFQQNNGDFDAVAHTHCYSHDKLPLLGLDPRTPSTADYVNQKVTNKPWLIYALDGENVSSPVMFPMSPDTPLEGREFIYYVSDCWNVVQDYYWQNYQIELPCHPVEDGYKWEDGKTGAECKNYHDYLPEWGFHEVPLDQMENGDVVVMGVLGNCNHVGVCTGNNEILQQLARQRSCIQPIGRMVSFIAHIYRYTRS